jgi:GDPmannose 4,6-dehydratase
MTQKTACITGCSGQVGSVLTKDLLKEGYKVFGLKRRSSSHNTERLNDIFDHPNLKLVYGDILDLNSLHRFLDIAGGKPDYFYHTACNSHVGISYMTPSYSFESVANGTLNCLLAIKENSPKTRFLHFASSEQFGSSPPDQNEKTEMMPVSPYACGKLAAYHLTRNFRNMKNGIFAANGIFFNIESFARGENFVVKKSRRAATRIFLGLQNELRLGNLKSFRDWNNIYDSIAAAKLIIDADEPDDFCVSTGVSYSIEHMVDRVFAKLGMDWKKYVVIDPTYFRDAEVDHLKGDSTKLETKLGWSPQFSFEDTLDQMIDFDMKLAKQEKLIKDNEK